MRQVLFVRKFDKYAWDIDTSDMSIEIMRLEKSLVIIYKIVKHQSLLYYVFF